MKWERYARPRGPPFLPTHSSKAPRLPNYTDPGKARAGRRPGMVKVNTAARRGREKIGPESM